MLGKNFLACFTYFMVLVEYSKENCPPETGIYLYYQGKCVLNGTYFRDTHLQIAGGQNGYIRCVLPGQLLNDGGWFKPNGNPVRCRENTNTDPFLCDAAVDGSEANVSLYLQDDDDFSPLIKGSNFGIETEYRCCLPNNCTDPKTNIITINVFERVYIINSYFEILTEITALPQLYRVHFIVTGRTNADVELLYYVDSKREIPLSQLCDDSRQNTFNCSVDSSMYMSEDAIDVVFDYYVTVEWSTIEINNTIELFRHDGDHVYLCTAEEGAVSGVNRREKTVTVKAPAFSPTNLLNTSVSYNTILVHWSYPLESDAYGFVLNVSRSSYWLIPLNGTTRNTFTIRNLKPSTNYSISVRAFQDILGPSSNLLTTRTANAPKITSSLMKKADGYLSISWRIDSESDGTVGLQTIAIKCRTQADSNVVESLNISCINASDGCDSTGSVSIRPVVAANYSCLVIADYVSFIIEILTNHVSITKGIPSAPISTSVTKQGVFGDSRWSGKRSFMFVSPSVSVDDGPKRSTDIGTIDAMITLSPQVTNSIQPKDSQTPPTTYMLRMLFNIYIILLPATVAGVGILMLCIGFTLGYLCHFKLEVFRSRRKKNRRNSKNVEIRSGSCMMEPPELLQSSAPVSTKEPLYSVIEESLNYCKKESRRQNLECHELNTITSKEVKQNTQGEKLAFPQCSVNLMPEEDGSDYELMSSHQYVTEKDLSSALYEQLD